MKNAYAHPLHLPIKLIGELSDFSKHSAVLPDVKPICTYNMTSYLIRISNSRRGHCHKLYLPTCKSNIRYNYFSHRVIHVWNRLPEKTNFESFNAFRETLTSEIL